METPQWTRGSWGVVSGFWLSSILVERINQSIIIIIVESHFETFHEERFEEVWVTITINNQQSEISFFNHWRLALYHAEYSTVPAIPVPILFFVFWFIELKWVVRLCMRITRRRDQRGRRKINQNQSYIFLRVYIKCQIELESGNGNLSTLVTAIHFSIALVIPRTIHRSRIFRKCRHWNFDSLCRCWCFWRQSCFCCLRP